MSIAEKLTTIAENEQKVFEAGKSKKWQEFMTSYFASQQWHGLAFFGGSGWNNNTFYPTKNFRATPYCFYYHSWGCEPYDMAARLEECGVSITSVNPNSTFFYCYVTRLPELKLENGDLTQTFRNCSTLVTIDKLILGSNITSTTNAFYQCSSLKNIVIEGEMPVSISLSSSPLTVGSMRSIIASLTDYSGTATTKTLTLKATASQNLTDEDRQNITNKGWTLSEV